YVADDPRIASEQRRAPVLQDRFSRTGPDDAQERCGFLGELLGRLGGGAEFPPPLYVDHGYRIRVGRGVCAHNGLVALDVAAIEIGDDTQIGPNVQLLTPTHPLDPELRRAKWEAAEPITIGANVWLGGGVIVLPGITIGDDTVVGAGAVVSR